MTTKRVALSACLLSVMLIMGYIESLFPLPAIPGVKLGLSNSVLLISLYWLGIVPSILLMVLKVTLSGLLFGGVSAMMYALAGGVVSLSVMILLVYGIRGVTPVGAGIAGAVAHNVGQIGLSMVMLSTDKLIYYMAILMLVGVATGLATGTVARLVMKHVPPPAAVRFPERSAHG